VKEGWPPPLNTSTGKWAALHIARVSHLLKGSDSAGAVAALFFPNHYWLVFWVTFALVAAISWVFLMELYRRVRSSPRKEVMSHANLVNSEGTVVKTVKPGTMSGKVRIGGDVWSAQAEDELPPGTRVVVVGTEGVRVIVRKAEQ
jgi:membrane protein implicated in regulation of membrane protease activity